MIFITGDTHGTHDITKLLWFEKTVPTLTKADYMIICGDFGGVWSQATVEDTLAIYSRFPFTTLFVDGNHENFDLLNAYPEEKWNGGRIHRLAPDIIHLMRGQVFKLEGKTFFSFGGGTSIDKSYRTEGVSWWPQEMPTDDELEEGIANLKRHKNKVDYIITHTCDEKALWYPPLRANGIMMQPFRDNLMLNYFEYAIKYKHWFFGHYHLDSDLTENKTVLYQKIVALNQ